MAKLENGTCVLPQSNLDLGRMHNYSVSLNLTKAFTALCRDLDVDSKTVQICVRRINSEGVAFCTKTLPLLSKAVLRSLELGYFERPTNFAWKGRSLLIFNSLLNRIFDSNGSVLPQPCSVAIYAIRQVCEYMYKLAFEFSEEQLAAAQAKYVEVEERVGSFRPDPKWVDRLRRNATRYYPELFGLTVDKIFGTSRPRVGPGAFFNSEKESVPFYVYKALDDSVIGTTGNSLKAFSGYFKPYPSAPTRVVLTKRGDERQCRVIFVPKDSRGPRVISKEPLHLLRAQLSFFDTVSSVLERESRYRINFRSQEVNRTLARAGSIDGSYATFDLKDASDSVSYSLMRSIFEYAPGVRYFLTRLRSTSAVLPDKRVCTLAKLSGMGSGLTFPLMAFLIHLSVTSYVSMRTGEGYESVGSRVYVYGDDLVVPACYSEYIGTALSASGLVLNLDKCFTRGPFRESCGFDAFLGNNIAPVRLKLPGAELGDPSLRVVISNPLGLVELERHCRELVASGLMSLANYYYTRLEKAGIPLPPISGDADCFGRWSASPALVDDDQKFRVVKPAPVRLSVRKSFDPYKYLSSSLARSQASWAENIGLITAGVKVFGEVTCSRALRLINKSVKGLNLRGLRFAR